MYNVIIVKTFEDLSVNTKYVKGHKQGFDIPNISNSSK